MSLAEQCLVNNCDKRAHGRGYCAMHYWRLMKHGDVNHKNEFVPKKCSIEGCVRNSRKRTWCASHYERWRKYGDPNKAAFKRESHGMSGSQVYRNYRAMKWRCKTDKYYIAKGIVVCDVWRDSFLAFYKDMGSPPTKQYSLDRIDNDGNYEPGNCRWVTHDVQVRNTGMRKSNTSGHKGVSFSRACNKWSAYVTKNGKRLWLGWYENIDDAIRVREAADEEIYQSLIKDNTSLRTD